MARIVCDEDLWDELGVADIIFVTTNASLDRGGSLVMGAGAAKEAADRFKGLPAHFGEVLHLRKKVRRLYGIMDTTAWFKSGHDRKSGLMIEGTQIGGFQTKIKWDDNASLDAIKYSVSILSMWSERWSRIALNFPGIGLGNLRREDVLPVVMRLPDNVWVYEKTHALAPVSMYDFVPKKKKQKTRGDFDYGR